MTDLGSYLEINGRPAVRFVRTYPHPIERVWSAVTEPAELKAWFPSAVDVELRAGGVITFSGDPNIDDMPGTVLAVDAPRHFAFSWGEDELRFDLEPVDDGSCRLTLTNVLAERDTAARNASGWVVCLAELDKHLRGEPSGGPHSPDALDFPPLYDAHVSAGVPSGAPIPKGPSDA
jgi:uncharacterized protein YndB with AHSA1/START domain